MTPDEIRAGMAKHTWFHHIDLGHGIITPGAGGPDWNQRLEESADIYYGMGIKFDSVLDVGAFDGFNSFAAERRGASRVLAADYVVWHDGSPCGNRSDVFDFARTVLKSRVEKRVIDIPEMSVATVGRFDHVGFNGIVYHIRNPFSALERMAEIAVKTISIETAIDCLDIPRGVALFYPSEPSNPPLTPATGWGFNSLCMHAYLKMLGFGTVLEWPTPNDPTKRSIFIGVKPGHCADYIAANAAFTKPRFTGRQ